MADAELLLYSKGLEEFPDAAIGAVIEHLMLTPRGEYEPTIPALADLREMVRLQVRKDNAWTPCGRCNSGHVVVEREGHTVAVRCECWISWKKRSQSAQLR